MTEPTEQELLRKVGEIHVALFGMEGQPQMGAIPQIVTSLKDHSNRIGVLEKWRWYVVGAVSLAILLLKLWGK